MPHEPWRSRTPSNPLGAGDKGGPRPLRPHAVRQRSSLLTLVALALVGGAAGCGGAGKDEAVPTPSLAQGIDTASPTDTAAAPDPHSLIGLILHESLPDSSIQASWTMYPLERRIGIRHVTFGGRHLLIADSLVGYDGPIASWRIRQVQPVETPGAGEGYVASCAITGANAGDGTVVARVTHSLSEDLSAHAAWRLNPVTWRFRPFPVDSLSCYNEGGGS